MYIVADDLTGAADASVAFAGSAPVRLLLELPAGSDPMSLGHLAIDLDCRDDSGDVAAARTAATLDRLPRGVEVFVKVDSLLRGRIADMLRELCRWAGERPVVVAPALPAMGRSIVGGRLRINGAQPGHLPSLFDLLDGAGPSGMDIAGLRSAPQGKSGAWVLDAATDADLDAIVAATRGCVLDPIWVGTSGLAKAVARARDDVATNGHQAGRAHTVPQRCVAVVGSASSTSAM